MAGAFVPEDECDECAVGDGNPCGLHEGVTLGVLVAEHLWRVLLEQVMPADDCAVLLDAYGQLRDAQEFYGTQIASWSGFAALAADTRARLPR